MRLRSATIMPEVDLIGDFNVMRSVDTLISFVQKCFTDGRDYSEQSSANFRLINKISKDLLLWQRLSDEEQQDIMQVVRARMTNTFINTFSGVMRDYATTQLL